MTSALKHHCIAPLPHEALVATWPHIFFVSSRSIPEFVFRLLGSGLGFWGFSCMRMKDWSLARVHQQSALLRG